MQLQEACIVHVKQPANNAAEVGRALPTQLGGYAFIGEGIPIGLGAAFQVRYRRVRTCQLSFVKQQGEAPQLRGASSALAYLKQWEKTPPAAANGVRCLRCAKAASAGQTASCCTYKAVA